ncbi:hypothetical protein CR513_01541, partial [Mucuna pruriens]
MAYCCSIHTYTYASIQSLIHPLTTVHGTSVTFSQSSGRRLKVRAALVARGGWPVLWHTLFRFKPNPRTLLFRYYPSLQSVHIFQVPSLLGTRIIGITHGGETLELEGPMTRRRLKTVQEKVQHNLVTPKDQREDQEGHTLYHLSSCLVGNSKYIIDIMNELREKLDLVGKGLDLVQKDAQSTNNKVKALSKAKEDGSRGGMVQEEGTIMTIVGVHDPVRKRGVKDMRGI